MKNIVDNIISTTFDDLHTIELKLFEKIGLIVEYKNSKYEFIIHLVDFDNDMVVLGSSFLSPREKIKFKNRPFFERQSWIKDIKHNVIYYNDPTLYDYEGLDGGWGVGTTENWHLENISQIIKKLSDKLFDYDSLKIPQYGNLFFYGGSMGGFMSIALSILIKNSTSIADSPQFNLFTWWYWDSLKQYCFNSLTDEEIMQYSYRLDIIDLIHAKNVIPNSYIILDCTDKRDWDTQFRYFLNNMDSLPYSYNNSNNNINLKFTGKCIGHDMLYKTETINLIDEVINLQKNKFRFNPNKSEMLMEFKKHVNALYEQYSIGELSFDYFKRAINTYYGKWCNCRVDLKNKGNSNNHIQILENKNDANIDFPEWFNNEEGVGCTVSSNKPLDLKIKCITKGELNIIFRGHDYRINETKRIPIHICYNNFKKNNKLMFSKDFLLWHNREYTFAETCENNEIIDIKIEFNTINDYFPKLNELLQKLTQNEKNIKENYIILKNYMEEQIAENPLKNH